MRLGGRVKWLAAAESESQVVELVKWAKDKNAPFIMIGQGSNIIWRDEGFEGLVIINNILGKQVITEDDSGVSIRLSSGEIWDEAVAWTASRGWSGIEFMSYVPGLVGAAPVQNIGAYGAELSDTLIEVEVFDIQMGSFGGLLKDNCNFSYRNSRFKSEDKGRYLIMGIVLRLSKKAPSPPFYESLQKYFDEHPVAEYTPENIRAAIKEVRHIRLPDPSQVANNGSFFVNPIIDSVKYTELTLKYPDLKGWPMPDGRIKIPAGWMVEKAGFKDVHDPETGMGTWPANALVLVNEHAGSTKNLLAFRQKILEKVLDMFGVLLRQEPELLP